MTDVPTGIVPKKLDDENVGAAFGHWLGDGNRRSSAAGLARFTLFPMHIIGMSRNSADTCLYKTEARRIAENE